MAEHLELDALIAKCSRLDGVAYARKIPRRNSWQQRPFPTELKDSGAVAV
jgi:hypothetical protein